MLEKLTKYMRIGKMLDDGMLLMNDAFKERVDADTSNNFSISVSTSEEELLTGSFVSLMNAADGEATIVFTTANFWKAIDLSNNIKEYSNLYIKLSDMIIRSVDTKFWHVITVERVGQAARVTLSVNPSWEVEDV